ncbi:MutS-like protein [Phytophthora pseudosyringae]|uniref:MutS-like protein n=1 Tax=Phytophthora pseudosyringae TaxID=221518 RepID=A0A8T1V7P2_9STRA|nr:MutS-like protein [Phytophthora pseudosyringae]
MLNQLGCFVPCKEAVLPVLDAIYLRTGAIDQQLYGYSTFMTEMREMAHILSAMTPNSLVLIEDLCRGTSTSEGVALALSICQHLMESKTLTCFSSQWRELTEKLAGQPATVFPMWGHSDSRIHSRLDCKASQDLAEFDKLMRDCDLPPDLISLISEEIHKSTTD